MLAKKNRTPVQRFPRKAETIYRGALFAVKKSKNNLSHSRIGVIVPKGASKSAVKRNGIKREIYDAFLKEEGVVRMPGRDYLVIINSSAKLDDGVREAIREDLDKLILSLKK